MWLGSPPLSKYSKFHLKSVVALLMKKEIVKKRARTSNQDINQLCETRINFRNYTSHLKY
jgi:hypothetical protein